MSILLSGHEDRKQNTRFILFADRLASALWKPVWRYWAGSFAIFAIIFFQLPWRPYWVYRLWLPALELLGVLGISIGFILTAAAFLGNLARHRERGDRHGSFLWAACMIVCAPTAAALHVKHVEFESVRGPLTVLMSMVLLGFVAALTADERPSRATKGLAAALIPVFLVSLCTPNFRAARERANTRACYANQKTIAGALEMYNLDKNTKLTVMDPSVLGLLKSGGYLSSTPQDPGQGENSNVHYQYTPGGNGIRCEKHGTIQ